MASFSSISIIYNPNSTGKAKKIAQNLYDTLRAAHPKLLIEMIATKSAGHAEDLTYQIASKFKQPLIISASGDGGYNEIVNGAVKAYKIGYRPVTGLLPAGNANDHYNSINHEDITRAINLKNIKKIDILELDFYDANKQTIRYAHSYIGFGMTPQIGEELTKKDLNRFNEILTVLHGLFKSQVVQLELNGSVQSFDSFTVSNIDRMAKMLTLSKDNSVHDGLFEVTIVKHHSPLSKLAFVFKAATAGISNSKQADSLRLKTIKPTAVQLDGEVITIPANTQVSITISSYPLLCI